MEDKWIKLIITNLSLPRDIVIAWLDARGVEAVQEFESHIEAYIKDEQKSDIEQLLNKQLHIKEDSFSFEKLENKNWNAVWEANFTPVSLGQIYIRAPFHPPNEDVAVLDILLSPKMAFGTGHHETTCMMSQYLNSLKLEDTKILDYGTGTGILAIIGLKLGAGFVTGIDIQNEAIENAFENMDLNKIPTHKYHLEIGDLDIIGTKKFDLILANINRHVLLSKTQSLHDLLNDDGQLVCSGILEKDINLVREAYTSVGFHETKVQQRGEWMLIVFNK